MGGTCPCSSADPLAQIFWEGVPGGQVFILSWVMVSSHLVLPVLKRSSLEALDCSFPVEISITAYLEASGEGKVFQLS